MTSARRTVTNGWITYRETEIIAVNLYQEANLRDARVLVNIEAWHFHVLLLYCFFRLLSSCMCMRTAMNMRELTEYGFSHDRMKPLLETFSSLAQNSPQHLVWLVPKKTAIFGTPPYIAVISFHSYNLLCDMEGDGMFATTQCKCKPQFFYICCSTLPKMKGNISWTFFFHFLICTWVDRILNLVRFGIWQNVTELGVYMS